MWRHILLSALAFSFAFFFSEYAGFLVLLSPLPLIHFFLKAPLPWVSFQAGWWWGVCVFGLHFTWLLELLVRHSSAHWQYCVMLYAMVVGYFAVSSACWFWLTARLAWKYWTIPVFMLTTMSYWMYLEHYIFVLPELGTGYPFFNPCIPLASYQPFLRLISIGSVLACSGVNIVYIPPVINRVKNVTAPWRTSPEAVAHKIHCQLSKNVQVHGPSLYAAPESTFPFALNLYPQVTRFWRTGIPTASHFFVGSILQKGVNRYQAVFWLQGSLIINIYVKKMLTPFVENIPARWRNISFLHRLFLQGAPGFCEGKITENGCLDSFDVTPKLRIIPRICLELFFLGSSDFDQYKDPTKNVIILFFANDSWFNEFFRKILYNFITLKSYLVGLPIVYVGHFGCFEIGMTHHQDA